MGQYLLDKELPEHSTDEVSMSVQIFQEEKNWVRVIVTAQDKEESGMGTSTKSFRSEQECRECIDEDPEAMEILIEAAQVDLKNNQKRLRSM